MTKPNYGDDDISLEEWMECIDKVLDAYANEVGMMRQFNRQTSKNIANLTDRVKALEEEKASYEASVYVPEEID